MTAPLLEMKGVSKLFRIYQGEKTLLRLGKRIIRRTHIRRDLWALKAITLSIAPGERIALIGHNGAGKSTLLRVAAGIYQPTEGSVTRRAPMLPLFRYGVGLQPDLPVIDNLYILGAFYGILRHEIDGMMESLLDFADLGDLRHVEVKNLSSGQVARLTFSVFTRSRATFLAFDESMAMADIAFQQKARRFFRKLMNNNTTFLMASHSLASLPEYCTRAVWLDRGEIKMEGAVDEVLKEYVAFSKPLLGNQNSSV